MTLPMYADGYRALEVIDGEDCAGDDEEAR